MFLIFEEAVLKFEFLLFNGILKENVIGKHLKMKITVIIIFVIMDMQSWILQYENKQHKKIQLENKTTKEIMKIEFYFN